MFYEGIQSALRRTTIDDDVVHFIRIIHTKVSGKIQKTLICINIVLIIDHRSYLN